MSQPIPYFKPWLPPWEEMEPVLRGIHESGHLSFGPITRLLEEAAADLLGVCYAVACSSCTAGMMALLGVMHEPGAAVVLPAFSFSATLQAVEWAGLMPIFCDVREEDCNIDVDAAEAAITPDTEAILAVHISGVPCDVGGLCGVSGTHGPDVYYDGAHALGSRLDGKSLACYGRGTVYSLGATKLLTAGGEGGIVATDDGLVAERVRLAINHGRRPGEMDCVVKGMNARMTEMQAAYALAALPHVDELVMRRHEIWRWYLARLHDLAGLRFPCIHGSGNPCPTWKDISIFVDPDACGWDSTGLRDALAERGIQCRQYYWPPLHMLETSRAFHLHGDLPVAERLASQVLSLPSWHYMEVEHVERVCNAIRDIIGQGAQA